MASIVRELESNTSGKHKLDEDHLGNTGTKCRARLIFNVEYGILWTARPCLMMCRYKFAFYTVVPEAQYHGIPRSPWSRQAAFSTQMSAPSQRLAIMSLTQLPATSCLASPPAISQSKLPTTEL